MKTLDDVLYSQPGDEDEDLRVGQTSKDAVEDDGTPVLDEDDLEENSLTVEEADNIVWDEADKES
jgi:hypothetical protein